MGTINYCCKSNNIFKGTIVTNLTILCTWELLLQILGKYCYKYNHIFEGTIVTNLTIVTTYAEI